MPLRLLVSSEKRCHFEALIRSPQEYYESSGTLHPKLLGNYRRQDRAPCLGLKILSSSFDTPLLEIGGIFWGRPRLTTPNSRGRIDISRFPFYFNNICCLDLIDANKMCRGIFGEEYFRNF